MGLFTITKDIKALFDEYNVNTTEGLQTILIGLRKLGYSQIDSIKILMEVLALSLSEANQIICSSKAWNNDIASL